MSMLYWIWKDIQNEILNISERNRGNMGKEFENKRKIRVELYFIKHKNDDILCFIK